METINTTNISPGIDYIPLTTITPISTKIYAAADTGANIDAISGVTASRHIYRSFVKKTPRAFKVRTGSGMINCNEYLPMRIRQDGQTHFLKLYVIWDLPYDYIIGRPTQRQLGWYLKGPRSEQQYYHPREMLDCVEDDEKIDRTSFYPTKADVHDAKLDLPNIKISDRDDSLKTFIQQQLHKHHSVVAKHEYDIGKIPDAEFEIDFKRGVDTTPIQCNEYPHNRIHVAEIERQLAYLLQIGFISKSKSSWRFPTFIVPKKNGEARIVFDYRLLNQITKTMSYPLPDIQRLIDNFKGNEFISTIDIKSGYWHIPIKTEDRSKTAFVFNGKLYEWNVMPFGPTNAPPYFQHTMDRVFADMDYVMVYMDDITIVSQTAEQHKIHLKNVFKRLQKYKIKIRPDKCKFAAESVEFLGYEVDGTGSNITTKYKDKIWNIPTPTSKPQLRRFVGMIQFVQRFIPSLQLRLAPFHEMNKKNVQFHWNDELQSRFDECKRLVKNATILHHPDMNLPFEVFCDASVEGMGAVLVQRQHGKRVVIQYCSKKFSNTQQNWHVSEQEIYAVIHAVEKWRQYLIAQHFRIYTDHKNLQELFNRAKNFRAGKLYRWAVRLQDFEFTARYIKAHKNYLADYLSRDALYRDDIELPSKHTTKKPNTHNILTLYTKHVASTIIHYQSIHHIPTPTTPAPSSQSSITTQISNSTFSSTNSMCPDPITTPSIYIIGKTPIIAPITAEENDVIGMSDDEMPEPNETPDPPLISSEQEPSPSTSVDSITVQIPHKYNTRQAARIRRDVQHHQNLNRKMLMDVDESSDYFDPNTAHSTSLTTVQQQNKNIINAKDNQPTYNHSLLSSTHSPICTGYDITHISNKTIKAKQLEDPQLFPIIQYLKHHNKYLLEDLPEYLYNLVLKGRYYLSNSNILMYRFRDDRGKVVIPKTLISNVLRWAHGNLHDGQSRMVNSIKDRFWWNGYRNDVAAYTNSCDGCQKAKHQRNTSFTSGNITTFSTKAPFELISIDIVGPLPQTTNGNRYILSMIDKFSRFCLLVPMKDMRTMTVVKAYQRWINLFGPPSALLSDNGTQFISQIFTAHNKIYNVQHRYSTPYYPESNGQIERLHRWIKERLVLISINGGLNFIDGEDDWDEYIDAIQHGYNSKPNTMTKFSPNKIIFGHDFLTNLDRINHIIPPSTTPTEYIKYINNVRNIIHSKANANQQRYDKTRTKSYNKHRNPLHKYEIGDLVLINQSRRLHGNEKKLSPAWDGPFEIIKITDNDKSFHVREVGNEANLQRVNVRFIKPYTISPYITVMSHSINVLNTDFNRSYDRIVKYIEKRKTA